MDDYIENLANQAIARKSEMSYHATLQECIEHVVDTEEVIGTTIGEVVEYREELLQLITHAVEKLVQEKKVNNIAVLRKELLKLTKDTKERKQ